MGIGITIHMGFLWDSHGNGSSFGPTNGNGNSIFYNILTGSVNSLLFFPQ